MEERMHFVLFLYAKQKILGDDSRVEFYVNYIDFEGVALVYIVSYLKCLLSCCQNNPNNNVF